jgi:endonuclease YncB( thermonuclease family)
LSGVAGQKYPTNDRKSARTTKQTAGIICLARFEIMGIFSILFRVTTAAQPAPKPRYPNREERAARAKSLHSQACASPGTQVQGRCYVIDGDTIVINSTHIRLAGIDAPELDHPWGQKAKWALVALCKGQRVTAHIRPELSHDRVVATCLLDDGRDLAQELVSQGLALDWAAYSGGKYRVCEPPDARRRLWKTAMRQSR